MDACFASRAVHFHLLRRTLEEALAIGTSHPGEVGRLVLGLAAKGIAALETGQGNSARNQALAAWELIELADKDQGDAWKAESYAYDTLKGHMEGLCPERALQAASPPQPAASPSRERQGFRAAFDNWPVGAGI